MFHAKLILPLWLLAFLILPGTEGMLYAQTGPEEDSPPGIGYMVFGQQDLPDPDTLYTYDFEEMTLSPLELKQGEEYEYDNLNGLAYYCSGACGEDCSLYMLQTDRDVDVMSFTLPEVNMLKFDLEEKVFSEIGIVEAPPSLPPDQNDPPFGVLTLSSALHFIGAAATDGSYYLTGLSVKYNLMARRLIQAKCYVGKIDLNNIEFNDDGEIVVEWHEIVVNDDFCQDLIDSFVSQTISEINPLESSISGGIQDFALSRKEDALVSFLGFENAFMSIDLETFEATCFPGPDSNHDEFNDRDYTGFFGARSSEMGGMFRDENGLLYAHQVDDGRLFLVDETTGELTLVENITFIYEDDEFDGFPKHMRGDAASVKFAASSEVECIDNFRVTVDEVCRVTVTPGMIATGKVCGEEESDLYEVVVDADPDLADLVDGFYEWPYQLYYRPYPYSDELVLLCEGKIRAEDRSMPEVYCPPDVKGLRKYLDDNEEHQYTPYPLDSREYITNPEGLNDFEDWFEDDDGFNEEGLIFNRLICDDIEKIVDLEASWADPDYEYYTGVATSIDACSGETREPTRVEDNLDERECDYSEEFEYGGVKAILYRTFYFEDDQGNEESCTQRIFFYRPYIHLPVCEVELEACEYEEMLATDDLLNSNPYALPFYINGIDEKIYFTPDPSESGIFTTKEGTCDLSITYSEEDTPGPDGCGIEVTRSWTIIDDCWDPSLGDCDGDGIPDDQEQDSDGNGVPDDCEGSCELDCDDCKLEEGFGSETTLSFCCLSITLSEDGWVSKDDSPGEYVGFEILNATLDGQEVDLDDIEYTVKAGQNYYFGSGSSWINPDGTSGPDVPAISHITFCENARLCGVAPPSCDPVGNTYPWILGRPLDEDLDELYACYEFEDDWDGLLGKARKSVRRGGDGREFTWEQKIFLVDKEAPVIVCLGDDLDGDGQYNTDHNEITVKTIGGTCEALIDLEGRLLITDNCELKRFRYQLVGLIRDPKSGVEEEVTYGWTDWNDYKLPNVPAGRYKLVVEAEDYCGNVTTLTQEDDCRIIVEDQVRPIADCNRNLSVFIGGPRTNNDGLARVSAEEADGGSRDDCGFVFLHVRRTVEEDCLDAYLQQVEGLSGVDELSEVHRRNLKNVDLMSEYPEREAGFFYFKETSQGPQLVLIKKERSSSTYYTRWADDVFFTCCDASAAAVTLELRATDQGGGIAICNITTTVKDGLAPSCEVSNATVLCTDLDFDPTNPDPGQIATVFGAAEQIVTTRDNCGATLTGETLVWEAGRCGTGVLKRNFTVTDPFGNANFCTQEIVVEPANHYEITFPGDGSSEECGAGLEDNVDLQSFACDELEVTSFTTPLKPTGEECVKLMVTYRVVNWCEFDGRDNKPIEIPRDWDDDNDLAEDQVIRVATAADQEDLLPDVAGRQVVIWRQEDGDLAWINEEDYKSNQNKIRVYTNKGDTYFVDRTPGLWQYSQQVEVYDNTGPDVEVENESLSFCAYGAPPDDCSGNVNIVFNLVDDCTPDKVELRGLKLGLNGGQPEELADELGYELIRRNNTSYRITGKLPIGDHRFEVEVADDCGNPEFRLIEFSVIDCQGPAPVCKQEQTIELQPVDLDGDDKVDGARTEVPASLFVNGPADDCSPFDTPEKVKYYVFKNKDLEGGAASITPDMLTEEHSTVVFTCDDLGEGLVFLVAQDAAGNYDYCPVKVTLQVGISPSPCSGSAGEGLIFGIITDREVNPVAGVNVQLNGEATRENITKEDGLYSFSGLPEGFDYTVTPGKEEDPRNGVSTFDMVLITQHILRVREFTSPYQIIAADVNASGSVTTLDLIQVRKLILLVATGFSNNTSWRFIPAAHEFPDPRNPFLEGFPEFLSIEDLQGEITDADFIAVKTGDVNGSAYRGPLLSVDTRSGNLELLAEDIDLQQGETYTVDFSVADLAAIQGYQFTLHYDPASLEFVDLVNGVAAEEHFGIFPERGVLTTSWNPTDLSTPPPGDTRLFSLVLKAKEEAALSSTLHLSSALTPAEAYSTDDELLGVTLKFGAGKTAAAGFELYQNEPNPFDGQTVIGFNLPQATRAGIHISDATGRLLKVITGDFAKGYNQIRLQRSELPATGVLTYTIQTGRHTATRKMVVTQ